MAGISHNAKNSNLPEFGDSVSAGSKALCGLTEAAAQVKTNTAGNSVQDEYETSHILHHYGFIKKKKGRIQDCVG